MYLIVLTIAAWFAPKTSPRTALSKRKKFAILIPAHNEEVLLPELLESIQGLEYLSSHFDVHVIADNCTDRTATVAKEYSVNVHIRHETSLIGKGYALQWCLRKIRSAEEKYDAYIFIDADSILSSNFLEVMQAKLCSGAKIVQSYYGVKDPGTSWNVSLRYAALAVLHYLRPLGRTVFGGSSGLKGNGMLFTPDVLTHFPWATSVTEDIEYHMTLLLNGYSVKFAPDAVVWGEMPDTLEGSVSQHTRWESGRLQMARQYVPQLFGAMINALRRRDIKQAYIYYDAIMEHIIPPFSILFAISVLTILLSSGFIFVLNWELVEKLLTNNSVNILLAQFSLILGIGLVVGELVYLLVGLYLANAPRYIYLSLVYSPILIVWKILHYLRTVFGDKQKEWVRTVRNEG